MLSWAIRYVYIFLVYFFFNKIEYTLSNENIFDHGRVFYRAVTAFEIFLRPNFKVESGQKNGNILRNAFYQRIPLSVFTPIYWFHDKDVLFTGIMRVKSNLPIPNVTESNICGIPVGSGDKQMDNFRNTLNRYCNNHGIKSCLIENEWYLL